MAKDPAFLFYPGDWLGGTMGMTIEQKGAYMELLIYQFNNGSFTEAQAKQVLSICSANAWDNIRHKFKCEAGRYFNTRLNDEILKRKAFSESRRSNALHSKKPTKGNKKAYAKHMENENENRNEDINAVGIEERRKIFYDNIGFTYADKYPKDMLLAFCNYWTEYNEGAKKMKFEMQKVFNSSMRLVTWNNNNKQFRNGKQSTISNEGILEQLKKDITIPDFSSSAGG